MRAGDVVTTIDGQRVNAPTDLSTIINQKAPGDHVQLQVQRNGTDFTFEVILENRPAAVRTP
jgi:S1-C subfamily serine protease